MNDRRKFLKQIGVGLGGTFMSWNELHGKDGAPITVGGHQLPELPYPRNALEPIIDARTVELHHDIHHAGYVKGLNQAETMLAKARQDGDFSLIKHWERELAFHGGGHVLHSLYWDNLSPDGGGEPVGSLKESITRSFGGWETFKKQLAAATIAVEGSGWGVLALHLFSGHLITLQVENHQNLTPWEAYPLLAIDVWEHAYYLHYQNKRAEYVNNIFDIIHWSSIEKRFKRVLNLFS